MANEIDDIVKDVTAYIQKLLQTEEFKTMAALHKWVKEHTLEDYTYSEDTLVNDFMRIVVYCMAENNNIRELLAAAENTGDKKATQQVQDIFLRAVKALNAPDPIPPKTTLLPLDKLNGTIWGGTAQSGEAHALPVERQGSGKEINILYMLDFSNLSDSVTMTRRLLNYDKRLYSSVASLYNEGNEYMTISQIYHAMGRTGSPSKREAQRIDATLTKLNAVQITIDNSQEVAAGYKYPAVKYTSSLLPHERAIITRKGKTQQVVRLFRRPILIDFAADRRQITALDPKVLCTPWTQTEDSLAIEDYLLVYISRKKQEKKRTHRILLATMYQNAGITETKQKKRITERLPELLDYYKTCKLIAAYRIDEESVTVKLPALATKSQGKKRTRKRAT